MGLYANRALLEFLYKAGDKLKEKKDRKRKAHGSKKKNNTSFRNRTGMNSEDPL